MASSPTTTPVYMLSMAVVVLMSACKPADSIEVELFAPGVISTELPEFSTSFSVTGDTVLFSRASEDFSELGTLQSVRTDEGWSEPDTVVYLDDYFAVDPFVSNDGTRIYLSSNRPVDGQAASWDTWIMQRVGNHWTRPINAGHPPNSDSIDIFVSETLEGDLVFMSTREGRQLYRADRTETGWAEAVPLDIPGVDGRNPGNPLISPSGNALVFAMASEASDENSNVDLFVTCRDEAGWGAPRALPAPVNSPFMDFAPGIGPNGNLYFTSQRPGVVDEVPAGDRRPGDLYRTTLDLQGLCR